jgi:hypothetical protein
MLRYRDEHDRNLGGELIYFIITTDPVIGNSDDEDTEEHHEGGNIGDEPDDPG